MAPKYLIETFGCQMNEHDSERMAGLLEAHGYVAAAGKADADVIVVNTCSVRERSVDKLHSRLGEIREETMGRAVRPVVAVTGCVAQQEGDKLVLRRALHARPRADAFRRGYRRRGRGRRPRRPL